VARGKQNLASMSVEALISLRENVGKVLSQKSEELRRQLQRLEIGGWSSSRGKVAKGGGRRGQKIPPKYRDPGNPSNVWAGRGAIPKWMAEKIKDGAKREDFLIGSRGAATRKKRSAKKARKRTKAKAKRKATLTRKKRQRSGAAITNNTAANEPRTE
jgi:DNA-binding protein H-NS